VLNFTAKYGIGLGANDTFSIDRVVLVVFADDECRCSSDTFLCRRLCVFVNFSLVMVAVQAGLECGGIIDACLYSAFIR